MKAVGGPHADPNADDPKSVVVEVKPVRKLKQPVSLAASKPIRCSPIGHLVRIPRLSVVPVSPEQWRRVEQLVKIGRIRLIALSNTPRNGFRNPLTSLGKQLGRQSIGRPIHCPAAWRGPIDRVR